MADQAKIVADKINRLTKYVNDLRNRKAAGLTSQQALRSPEAYTKWIDREIEMHAKKIEALRTKG